jgi:hypothetical protein
MVYIVQQFMNIHLSWLHIIHRLLLYLPLFQFCPEMLLLTSDRPHYHCRLGILLAGLNIHPSAPASSCTPSAPHDTDLLRLFSVPLGYEDPPPVFAGAEGTRCWLGMLAATACFICSMSHALSSTTLSHSPAHTCSTPCTTDTAT